MSSKLELQALFIDLEIALEALLELLDTHRERFWRGYFARSLNDVRQHHLAGATFVLGAFGGEDTFSDFAIRLNDPIQFVRVNAELTRLRSLIFDRANAIAAASAQNRLSDSSMGH